MQILLKTTRCVWYNNYNKKVCIMNKLAVRIIAIVIAVMLVASIAIVAVSTSRAAEIGSAVPCGLAFNCES